MLVHAVDYVADATVDYAPAVLWITGLSALWITMLRICGFPSPMGSGAYIHTCGAVGVVGEWG